MPISSRAQRIIARLFEQAPAILRPDFETMFDRATADLASAPGTAARACCKESVEELRRRRGEALPAFLAGLQRGCLAGVPSSPLAARAPGLQLLDEDAVDEGGTLASIAERHQFRGSLPLLLLGQRFAVLLAQPPQAPADVPLGPRAFGIALAGIARRFGICLHARMQLYRAYDLLFMARYPVFAEALDAVVDRAGVLPGLAFVPLRPRDVPGHAGRGRDADRDIKPHAAAPPDANASALDVINRALEDLRKAGRLPEARAAERREAITAMTKFLLRHGEDSPEWLEGMQVARSVLEAVHRREPASPQARDWIENALQSLGYDIEDAERLAVGLVTAGAAAPADTGGATHSSRGAREQRCFERLAALPVGTLLGFSGHRGELTQARLRYHYVEPRLLLLADEDDGQEGLYELDTLARRMAQGEVWVMRAAAPPADIGLAQPARDPARPPLSPPGGAK
jgi:hypothetical protein